MQDLSVSLFFYMLHTDLDNGFYMLISDRIYDRLSVSSALYKFALLKYLKLMRDGRLRHIECLGKLAYVHLAVAKNKQYLYSCGIAEYLKQLGQIV